MPIMRSSRLYLWYCRLWCVMSWLLAAGGRLCQSPNFPHPGRIACCPAPDRRPPATKTLHTISGNTTSIVSSSWWWAYECPKHVEHIISAIKHSVASSWFSSLRLYYDARTNIHQIIHTNRIVICLRTFNTSRKKWTYKVAKESVHPSVTSCFLFWTNLQWISMRFGNETVTLRFTMHRSNYNTCDLTL